MTIKSDLKSWLENTKAGRFVTIEDRIVFMGGPGAGGGSASGRGDIIDDVTKALKFGGWESVTKTHNVVGAAHAYYYGRPATPAAVVLIRIDSGIITVHNRDDKLRPIMPGIVRKSVPTINEAHAVLGHSIER